MIAFLKYAIFVCGMSTQNKQPQQEHKELEVGPVRECPELALLLGYRRVEYQDDVQIVKGPLMETEIAQHLSACN